MKLSVRARVANGLVICLLLPRIAETAVSVLEIEEGLNAFSADDDFDSIGNPGNLAVAVVDTAQISADPSGGYPTGCDPSGVPTLRVSAPAPLATTEDGRADYFHVSMNPPATATRYYYFSEYDPSGGDPSGGDPSGGLHRETTILPEKVAFLAGSCASQKVWVAGRNDGNADGNANFNVEIRDEYKFLVDTIPGVNTDNDNYSAVSVDILGPQDMIEGSSDSFAVKVTNLSGGTLTGNRLEVEASSGLSLLSYVASLMSGLNFEPTGILTPKVLKFDNVELQSQDVLILSLGVELTLGSPGGERITARFSAADQRNDDEFVVHMGSPE